MSDDPRLAVINAMKLLGKTKPQDAKNEQTDDDAPVLSSVPTARTRSAMEMLFRTTVDDLREQRVNIRQVATDLFNWHGKPRATKVLMRALTTALNTPGKYGQAVELTSYIAALSPLMEPDRLARIYEAINEVKTVYAPNMYVLQLSRQLAELLERYPEQVRERIAYDLWVSSHTGRWWDLSTGVQNQDAQNQENQEGQENQPARRQEAPVEVPDDESLVTDFLARKLTWSAEIAEAFSALPYNEDIIGAIRQYNEDYARGKALDPDTGLLAAYLPWVPLGDRTESPVSILLRELMNTVSEIEGFELPAKPRSFRELFPDIRLIVGNRFPFTQPMLSTNGTYLLPGVSVEIVATPAELMANKEYMGNCTWSYKGRMEDCEYVLYRIHDERHDAIYNGSAILRNNASRWTLGEINSRYNRGNVPADVREAFNKFLTQVPVPSPEYIQAVKQSKRDSKRRFRYRLY